MKVNISSILKFLIYFCFVLDRFSSQIINEVINQNNSIEVSTENLNQKDKGFLDGFISGFSIVFFAEIGDRTFILIMIYSIANNFIKTFLISNVILLSWNLLSILIGLNLQYYINRNFFEWFGIGLFTFYGIMMIYEGIKMESRLVEDEYMEEEKNLREKANNKFLSNDNDEKNEIPYLKNENNLEETLLDTKRENKNQNNLFDSMWAFGFTLLTAELGDKSQIAAIIIGATQNLIGVILGTSLAHLICSIIAIVFGRIFSHYITNKQITMIGGIIFILFAFLFLLEKL